MTAAVRFRFPGEKAERRLSADAGKDLTRALSLCKKAFDGNPENPAYLDSLGWVYYKLGLAKEAKTYMRRAREKSPHDKIIEAHFAEISKMQE